MKVYKPVDTTKDIPVCKDCSRVHEVSQPCPRRIANAYMMLPQALVKATRADMDWILEHPELSILDLIEDAVLVILRK